MKSSSRSSLRAILRLILLSLFSAVAVSVARAQVSFSTPPTYGGVGSVFVADFNGDGKPDILTGDGSLNLGNGDGTFTLGTPVVGGALAVADFNGDGKADVLQQGTGTLLVLLGNGDGTFQSPISTSSGASLTAVVAGDLTGNGKADVLGLFNNNLVVYISNGDGTFAAGVSYAVGNTGIGYEEVTPLGDYNGDQKVDVAVSLSGDNVPGQEVVFLGNGDGTFQAGKTSTGVVFPMSVVAGDFNNDGKLDLVIAAACDGTCALGLTSILLGNGDGTFQAPTPVISGNGRLAAADVNADGKLDLVLEADPTVAETYLGNGDGTFSNASNYVLSLPGYPGIIQPSWIAIADFNLDGKPDVAAGNAVLLGNGNGTFHGIQLGVVPGVGPAAITGDFENNGTPDVALLSNPEIGTTYYYNVYILRNNGAGALSLIHTYTLQEPGYGVATADFNGDGKLDLVVFGTDPITEEWSYSVLLGNGDGSFQSPVFYPQNIITAAEIYSIVIGDFNNDSHPDIAVSSANSSFALLLGKGDGTFAAPVYYFDGGAGWLVTADFNGDGKPDIAAGGATGTALLFGNGDGTFQAAVFPSNSKNFEAQFTADFNNDGKADLMSAGQVAQ